MTGVEGEGRVLGAREPGKGAGEPGPCPLMSHLTRAGPAGLQPTKAVGVPRLVRQQNVSQWAQSS